MSVLLDDPQFWIILDEIYLNFWEIIYLIHKLGPVFLLESKFEPDLR